MKGELSACSEPLHTDHLISSSRPYNVGMTVFIAKSEHWQPKAMSYVTQPEEGRRGLSLEVFLPSHQN